MVAHLLRLKLTLLRNSLRRNPWQLIGISIGGLYALGIIGFCIAGLLILRDTEIGFAQTVIVLGGSAAMLGWAVIPVVTAAADMTLDPARFTTFAVPMPQLLAGLALGGLIGVPGLATSLIALATVGTWSVSFPAAAAALAGAVLGVLSCVVLSKVVTTATARLAGSRRFKDASAVILMIPLVLMGPIAAAIGKGIAGSVEFLPALAHNLAWTPLGAAWAIAGDVAGGSYGSAALKFLIALATLAGLFVCWKIMLERALVTPVYSGAGRKRSGGLGLFKVFPQTPAGAVTARALTYWLRDPRYAGSLIVVPLVPALLLFQASQTGSYALLSYVGPLTAFLLAWSISSDVSYDSTAFALHLMTGVRGVDDRLGRVAPCLILGLPLVLTFTIIPCLILGDWDRLPGLIGLSVGVLFTGLGLSSVVSARYSVTVPLPGESPFKKPPGNVAQTMAVHSLGSGIMMVLVSPEVALVSIQATTGNPIPGWINLVLGPVLGLAFLVAGLRLGGKWMNARGPELLAQLAINR